MSAPIVAGDMVRTGTGLVREVTGSFSPAGQPARTVYALRPLTATTRARRSFAENVTLVRTFELRRFYTLLDLAHVRDTRGDVESGTRALRLAAEQLGRAKARGLDGPGELVAAARSYRLAIDARP